MNDDDVRAAAADLPLPEILRHVADVCGLDVAMALTMALGGQRVWLGRANASPALVAALGATRAEAVRAALAPQIDIIVPVADEARQRLRDRRILDAYVDGDGINQIAAKFGLHRATVYKTIKRAQAATRRPGAGEVGRQLDLLELIEERRRADGQPGDPPAPAAEP